MLLNITKFRKAMLTQISIRTWVARHPEDLTFAECQTFFMVNVLESACVRDRGQRGGMLTGRR